jgi:Cu-Zn family superoxide dismutase
MKQLTLAIGFGLVLCGIASAQRQTPTGTTGTRPASASANLVDVQGRSVGQAYLQQTPYGVLLKLDLKNATPGIHGLHIHNIGRCDRPSFDSAGGHFNPSGRQHGFLNPRGPHAGDLPNIEVPTTTQLSVEYLVADVTLDPGPRSLLAGNGSTIVIHAGKDDYMSDPAGESGWVVIVARRKLTCGNDGDQEHKRECHHDPLHWASETLELGVSRWHPAAGSGSRSWAFAGQLETQMSPSLRERA